MSPRILLFTVILLSGLGSTAGTRFKFRGRSFFVPVSCLRIILLTRLNASGLTVIQLVITIIRFIPWVTVFPVIPFLMRLMFLLLITPLIVTVQSVLLFFMILMLISQGARRNWFCFIGLRPFRISIRFRLIRSIARLVFPRSMVRIPVIAVVFVKVIKLNRVTVLVLSIPLKLTWVAVIFHPMVRFKLELSTFNGRPIRGYVTLGQNPRMKFSFKPVKFPSNISSPRKAKLLDCIRGVARNRKVSQVQFEDYRTSKLPDQAGKQVCRYKQTVSQGDARHGYNILFRRAPTCHVCVNLLHE